MISYLRNPHARQVTIDGANGQAVLESDMKDAGVKCKAVLPKVAEVVQAAAQFEQNLFADKICHADQPALEQAVSNCEHRAIGSGGGFGYSSIMELESVVLAHWSCANAKEKKKQKISY